MYERLTVRETTSYNGKLQQVHGESGVFKVVYVCSLYLTYSLRQTETLRSVLAPGVGLLDRDDRAVAASLVAQAFGVLEKESDVSPINFPRRLESRLTSNPV